MKHNSRRSKRRGAALNEAISSNAEYLAGAARREADRQREHARQLFSRQVWNKLQKRAQADGVTPEDFVRKAVESALA